MWVGSEFYVVIGQTKARTASAAIGGTDGLFFGNAALMIPQVVSVLGTLIYAGVLTWVILKVLDVTMGIRATEEDELMGLDLSQHNETGYTL